MIAPSVSLFEDLLSLDIRQPPGNKTENTLRCTCMSCLHSTAKGRNTRVSSYEPFRQTREYISRKDT